MRRALVVVLAIWVTAACAAPATSTAPPGPPDVRFTAVALPAGAVPEVLAADGDQLLVGVRREAAPQQPGLVRRGPDGTITDVPAQAATGYGRTAYWYSLAADGNRILAIGGDRGGAHGNVRWSVWTGSGAGVAEHVQAFSTFGGWGAGDLIDAVLTPGGSAVVGSWESADAGLDVAVWTPQGDSWIRRPSTGTPLQSTRSTVAFVTAATGYGPGRRDRGLADRRPGAGAGQAPVVWRSGPNATGWIKTVLPDAGKAGTSTAIRCASATCAVAGRAGREPGAVAARRRPVEPRPRPPADRGGRLRPARRPLRRRRVAHRDRGRPGPGEDRRGGGDDVDARRGGPRGAGHGGGPGRTRRSSSSRATSCGRPTLPLFD